MISELEQPFGTIEILEDELKNKVLNCKKCSFSRHQVIIPANKYVKVVPVLIKGKARVLSRNEHREVLLYHINAGEACVLSIMAALEQTLLKAHVVAAEPCEVIMVPTSNLQDWCRDYASWNRFVLKCLSVNYDQLLRALNTFAFLKIDQRIMEYLFRLTVQIGNDVVVITHQELANELGTTRVVISRVLKCLETEGKVELLRGAIKVRSM